MSECQQQETDFYECHVTMHEDEQNQGLVLMTESLGSAIVDTACTKTVCGQSWYNDFVETLVKTKGSK